MRLTSRARERAREVVGGQKDENTETPTDGSAGDQD